VTSSADPAQAARNHYNKLMRLAVANVPSHDRSVRQATEGAVNAIPDLLVEVDRLRLLETSVRRLTSDPDDLFELPDDATVTVGQVRQALGIGMDADDELDLETEHLSPETIASIMAVVDGPPRPDLDVRLEGDDA
jgi:hypothetical protein